MQLAELMFAHPWTTAGLLVVGTLCICAIVNMFIDKSTDA